MRQHLGWESLEKLLQSWEIENLSLEQITHFFLEDHEMGQFIPDGNYQIDPRNGDRVIYNTARARRPHDNLPPGLDENEKQKDCLICQGKTTHVIDVAELSEGFTFINKNLFPIFYPQDIKGVTDNESHKREGDEFNKSVKGFHFLQWTSSYHVKDWHNMPLGDRVIVFKRLAALEQKMMAEGYQNVSIIKNYGRLVGGSLSHGHQQIAVSNLIPNRIRQDQEFLEMQGESFSTYILRETPEELVIKDYGPAILLTPYFMRRPYDMFLVLKDTDKSNLANLGEDEIIALVEGWKDGISIIQQVMPRIDREIAYNITTHNGLSGGLYFEFLPYTQEMGGFEHLGLYLCQGNPYYSAEQARQVLLELDGD